MTRRGEGEAFSQVSKTLPEKAGGRTETEGRERTRREDTSLRGRLPQQNGDITALLDGSVIHPGDRVEPLHDIFYLEIHLVWGYRNTGNLGAR